jgi:Ni/Co efflux regulator RcnB
MKIKTVVSAILAISLLSAGGAAFADDHDDHGHGNSHDDHRDDHRDNHRDDHRNDHHDNRGDHRDERGAGPEHAFHRGDRLPPEYRDRQYVVEDWRDHRLTPPPRGYHWVQAGGDYVLVSIGNGIVLNFMLGN